MDHPRRRRRPWRHFRHPRRSGDRRFRRRRPRRRSDRSLAGDEHRREQHLHCHKHNRPIPHTLILPHSGHRSGVARKSYPHSTHDPRAAISANRRSSHHTKYLPNPHNPGGAANTAAHGQCGTHPNPHATAPTPPRANAATATASPRPRSATRPTETQIPAVPPPPPNGSKAATTPRPRPPAKNPRHAQFLSRGFSRISTPLSAIPRRELRWRLFQSRIRPQPPLSTQHQNKSSPLRPRPLPPTRLAPPENFLAARRPPPDRATPAILRISLVPQPPFAHPRRSSLPRLHHPARSPLLLLALRHRGHSSSSNPPRTSAWLPRERHPPRRHRRRPTPDPLAARRIPTAHSRVPPALRRPAAPRPIGSSSRLRRAAPRTRPPPPACRLALRAARRLPRMRPIPDLSRAQPSPSTPPRTRRPTAPSAWVGSPASTRGAGSTAAGGGSGRPRRAGAEPPSPAVGPVPAARCILMLLSHQPRRPGQRAMRRHVVPGDRPRASASPRGPSAAGGPLTPTPCAAPNPAGPEFQLRSTTRGKWDARIIPSRFHPTNRWLNQHPNSKRYPATSPSRIELTHSRKTR